VSFYWPEFGQNGKQNILISDILRHDASIDLLPEAIDIEWGSQKNIKDNKIGKVIESCSVLG
jgi:hypothetical protein